MNNREKEANRQIEHFPVWTYEQSVQAVPYITSVMNSIRELFLQMRTHRLRAKRLDAKPGHRDRQSIIEHDESVREADRLQNRLAEAATELANLNIHCVEPAAGVAMVPIVNADQLAWLVFDLFGSVKINAWRYHHDPLPMRRPLDEMNSEPDVRPMIA